MKHTRESIVALINECRKNGTRIDLSGQDLSGLDLHGVDLGRANLQSANLQKSDLQYANMRWADLRGTDLDYCDYSLSCRTLDIKADKRLVSQLLYHLCNMDVSTELSKVLGSEPLFWMNLSKNYHDKKGGKDA